MTIQELQVKRIELLDQIATAVKQISTAESSVQFATVPEMQQALELLDREIAAAQTAQSGAERRPRFVLAQYGGTR